DTVSASPPERWLRVDPHFGPLAIPEHLREPFARRLYFVVVTGFSRRHQPVPSWHEQENRDLSGLLITAVGGRGRSSRWATNTVSHAREILVFLHFHFLAPPEAPEAFASAASAFPVIGPRLIPCS